ncbi:osteopontin domain protein [Rhizoctonia solani 123E]|uniref:Osteopontin domain protein n=1 Tax=Rhizoctonia solani 123E TaxID=1423351 RepID=A0A074S821_9AGAM|nr:osteopontin domain protein [Rhizoctonia solani 123E]
MMMMICEPGPSSHGPRPVIENLDRFSVHELEQMRERQMKIVNRPRRVAAPPSDENERRRARLKVEMIELRLSALRAEEEMSNPRDQTQEIVDQLDLMNVGKPVQVGLSVKSKLSTRPYGMVANEPQSPTSPNGHIQFRPAMSEQEALQIQREAYALATAKKEADEERRALHAQAANTRGMSEDEKRRRILAYMSYAGGSDEEDEDDDMDEGEDGDDLFGEYEDGELDMEADEYGLGGIIQVDPGRYANFGD